MQEYKPTYRRPRRDLVLSDVQASACEPGVYLVTSRTRPDRQHRVDAVREECSCEDYQFNRARRPSTGGILDPHPERWCAHLERVMTIPRTTATDTAAERDLAQRTSAPHGMAALQEVFA